MPVEANAGGVDPVSATSRHTVREQMRGARCGEVLLVTGRLNRIEATVYNTLVLNDCPDDLWRALDTAAIKSAGRPFSISSRPQLRILAQVRD